MKQKEIIYIIASALFVVIVWIIFEIYHNSMASTISERLNSQILPIKADFDLKTIENIKKREKVEPLYKILENQEPIATQTPSASPSSTQLPEEQTESAQASLGGTLSL